MAQPDDASTLAQFAERTFRETFASVNTAANMDSYCTASFGTEIQRREILDANYVTLMAELDDELIAFAQLRLESRFADLAAEHPSEIYRIYVSGEWHGRGIAHTVMTEALARAAQHGSDCVWLGVWEDNPRAIAFYQKRGFRIVGGQSFKLGDDLQRDVVMAVEIGGS